MHALIPLFGLPWQIRKAYLSMAAIRWILVNFRVFFEFPIRHWLEAVIWPIWPTSRKGRTKSSQSNFIGWTSRAISRSEKISAHVKLYYRPIKQRRSHEFHSPHNGKRKLGGNTETLDHCRISIVPAISFSYSPWFPWAADHQKRELWIHASSRWGHDTYCLTPLLK